MMPPFRPQAVPAAAPARRRPGGWLRHLRRRERPARLAIASFLWAMLLGPALHLVNHRDDHRHRGAGAHDHGAGTQPHRHGDAPRATQPAPSDPTAVSTPGEDDSPAPLGPHGAGESLHFGLFLIDSAAPAVVGVPDLLAELPAPAPASSGRVRDVLATALPRGPPRTAASPESLRLI